MDLKAYLLGEMVQGELEALRDVVAQLIDWPIHDGHYPNSKLVAQAKELVPDWRERSTKKKAKRRKKT